MNPQGQQPTPEVVQAEIDRRVTIRDQKQRICNASANLLEAIQQNAPDLSFTYTSPVVDAYADVMETQVSIMQGELVALTTDIDNLSALLAQMKSPILRVTPTNAPTPFPTRPGPHGIR